MQKLSVITICYNDINIERTCESIVNQSWQDFEWIVIDGGSKKEIIDIINTYKSRINTFISDPDHGVYNAYNKGLNLAQGEFANFLNSGDNYRDSNVLKNIFEGKEYGEKSTSNIYTLYMDFSFSPPRISAPQSTQ